MVWGMVADGRYIVGLLFMSVCFSNEALAYVWWSPEVSVAARWILIFLPFFNVRTSSLYAPPFSVGMELTVS